MKKVRWGILGCSSFARRRILPAMLKANLVDPAAVASRTLARAEEFAAEFGLRHAYGSYDEMLMSPDIDAVHIVLPNSLHCHWTIRALESQKHVLCEKPFTIDDAEAEKVATAARKSGLHVMEGFMWRFHPQHEMAMAAIARGAIGILRLVRGAFTYQMQEPNIRADRHLGGGSLLDVGCYPVSAARFYFRSEPTSVLVDGRFDKGIDIGAAGVMRFEMGSAVFDCGFDQPFRSDLELVGTTGRIYFPRAWQPHEQATIYINEEKIDLPPANHYVSQIEHFSQCILNGTKPRFSVEDAVHQMKAMTAVRRSLDRGMEEKVC